MEKRKSQTRRIASLDVIEECLFLKLCEIGVGWSVSNPAGYTFVPVACAMVRYKSVQQLS
jgi:hypothetical protein